MSLHSRLKEQSTMPDNDTSTIEARNGRTLEVRTDSAGDFAPFVQFVQSPPPAEATPKAITAPDEPDQITEKCKVTNTVRRRHLFDHEVEAMIAAARRNRHGHRDAALILLGYCHGYRVCELVEVKWSDIDFTQGRIYIRRRKHSDSTTHPLEKREAHALRVLQRTAQSPYVFESERGGPMNKRNAQHLIEQAGRDAKLEIRVTAHMLRHGCGYKLANDGRTTRDIQGYLGHKNLNNVERYTRLAANRYDGFFRDF
jgi:type 1 fimbriae regulatory protein FimB/type 1 fimbriae regulatory protein FimE